jgi:hypothetical protein
MPSLKLILEASRRAGAPSANGLPDSGSTLCLETDRLDLVTIGS